MEEGLAYFRQGINPEMGESLEEFIQRGQRAEKILFLEEVSWPIAWKGAILKLMQICFAPPLVRFFSMKNRGILFPAVCRLTPKEIVTICLPENFWTVKELSSLQEEILLHELIHSMRLGIDRTSFEAELFAYSTSQKLYRRVLFLLGVAPKSFLALLSLIPIISYFIPELFWVVQVFLGGIFFCSMACYGIFYFFQCSLIKKYGLFGRILIYRLNLSEIFTILFKKNPTKGLRNYFLTHLPLKNYEI